jgi:hypothetical protein
MTRDEIIAADEGTLKVAINATLKEDWTADQITHADVLDECERRWGVLIFVHPMQYPSSDAADPRARSWVSSARADNRWQDAEAPTRRLAELRALALALKAKGVLK